MFNALKYSKDLEAAGFSREQAEATIDVFFKFMEHNFATKEDIGRFTDRFATKEDLKVFATKEDLNLLKQDFIRLEVGVNHRIKALENRMTIKLGLMQAASVGLLAALIKFA